MNERRNKTKTDLSYSSWHRTQSIREHFGGNTDEANRRAAALGMIDIDAVEYCRKCMEPLALIETQRSTKDPKTATITQRVAELALLDAWSMSFQVLDNVSVDEDDDAEIVLFKRQRIWPHGDDTIYTETPREFASWLESLRVPHRCQDALRTQMQYDMDRREY